MLRCRSSHRLTCLQIDSISNRMVKLVVEEIDDKVLQRQAEVKVETLSRGRGQGAYRIQDGPTNKLMINALVETQQTVYCNKLLETLC